MCLRIYENVSKITFNWRFKVSVLKFIMVVRILGLIWNPWESIEWPITERELKPKAALSLAMQKSVWRSAWNSIQIDSKSESNSWSYRKISSTCEVILCCGKPWSSIWIQRHSAAMELLLPWTHLVNAYNFLWWGTWKAVNAIQFSESKMWKLENDMSTLE